MRIFPYLIVVGCLFSCNDNTEQKSELPENLSFSLDTVFVDPGDDLIFLNDNLSPSDLSPDKRYLINFNQMDGYAERINLDELKLEKKIHFEKDGPDGIPSFISRFSISPEENLMIWSYQFYAVFDQNAKKVKDLELQKIVAPLLGRSEVHPMMLFEVDEQPDRMVGVFIQWEDRSYFLLDIDLIEREFKKTDLPELAKLRDFRVEIMNNGIPSGSYGVSVTATLTRDKIIVSNNYINEVLVFDIKGDSTYLKSWDTPLLGSKKNYQPPKQVERESGEIEEIIKNAKTEITYGNFIWDREENRFLRFSYSEKFGEEKNEYGQYIPTGATVYLSIFDENLDLIAESLVPELTAPPKKHFVKDKMIWIFENIEDELAFIRLTVE